MGTGATRVEEWTSSINSDSLTPSPSDHHQGIVTVEQSTVQNEFRNY